MKKVYLHTVLSLYTGPTLRYLQAVSEQPVPLKETPHWLVHSNKPTGVAKARRNRKGKK